VQEARENGVAVQLANALPGVNTDGDAVQWGTDTKLVNRIQLSTYPDTIGANLAGVEEFVEKHLEGIVHGVHILPFYPSSADRGFAPLTYREVDGKFGTWEQVEAFGKSRDLCADFMINHVSAESMQFKDFVEKGDEVRGSATWLAMVVERIGMFDVTQRLVAAALGATRG
jgi:glycosidase